MPFFFREVLSVMEYAPLPVVPCSLQLADSLQLAAGRIFFRFAPPAIIGTPTSRDPLCGYPAVAPSAGKATTRKRVPRDSKTQRLAPLVVLDTLLQAEGSFIFSGIRVRCAPQ